MSEPRHISEVLRDYVAERRGTDARAAIPHRAGRDRKPSGYWTRERCTQLIQQWVTEHGTVPTVKELNRNDDLPCVSVLQGVFGSLSGSWAAMGVEPWPQHRMRNPHPVYWTRQRIVDALHEWVDTHDGEVPRGGDFLPRNGLPAPSAIRLRFGSYKAMWDAARLMPIPIGAKRSAATRASKDNYRHANRRMVTGRGFPDSTPGALKHVATADPDRRSSEGGPWE